MQRPGYIQSRLMTARLATYHAVHPLDKGQLCDAELINAKLTNTEHAIDSAHTGMEIHAAHGLHPEQPPIERYLRDALHIFGPRRHLGHPTPPTSRTRTRHHQTPLVHPLQNLPVQSP